MKISMKSRLFFDKQQITHDYFRELIDNFIKNLINPLNDD